MAVRNRLSASTVNSSVPGCERLHDFEVAQSDTGIDLEVSAHVGGPRKIAFSSVRVARDRTSGNAGLGQPAAPSVLAQVISNSGRTDGSAACSMLHRVSSAQSHDRGAALPFSIDAQIL